MIRVIWNLICAICRCAATCGILYALITAPASTSNLERWVAVGVVWAIPMKD